MTRKDYELIAAAINEAAVIARAHAGKEPLAVRSTAHKIAGALAKDNARFDQERFMAACGF